MLWSSTIGLLLLALNANGLDQAPLDGSEVTAPDPKATESIRSIFSSLSSSGLARIKPEAVSPCCGAGCPLGLCNGRPAPDFETTAAPSGTATASNEATRALNLAQAATPCCSRSCPDGHCRFGDAVPTYTPKGARGILPPGIPDPLFPGRPESECPGGCGRECGISCPCVCARVAMTSVYNEYDPEPTAAVDAEATRADANIKPAKAQSKADDDEEFEFTQYFHTVELSGLNQDVIPIVVENASKDPITLIADIDLALMENYISSEFLKSLNLTSSTPIPKGDQQSVALGVDAFLVTPHSTVSLNILAGQPKSLEKFPNVEFNVFDLPVFKGKWEPELFVGLNFLRRARALTLTEKFSGQGAVHGIPVLLRDVVVSDKGPSGKKEKVDAGKDEL